MCVYAIVASMEEYKSKEINEQETNINEIQFAESISFRSSDRRGKKKALARN